MNDAIRLAWRRACNRLRRKRGIQEEPVDAASIAAFDAKYGIRVKP